MNLSPKLDKFNVSLGANRSTDDTGALTAIQRTLQNDSRDRQGN
jgi:hypothetical protein